MKGVQCYELFGGIALKKHAFSFFISFLGLFDNSCFACFSQVFVAGFSITCPVCFLEVDVGSPRPINRGLLEIDGDEDGLVTAGQ